MIRHLSSLLVLLVPLVLVAGWSAPAGASTTSTCRKAAPTTAAGYARMFGAVDTREWGAADVSLSVAMGTRSVWLFGDTVTSVYGRFNHSTAITQTRGCLRVSHGGGQVLPSIDARHYFWITGAKRKDSTHLVVTAALIWCYGKTSWSFRQTGTRSAVLALAANGDVTFQRWLRKSVSIAPSPVVKDGDILGSTVSWDGRVVITGVGAHDHRFTYGAELHPEARLTGGKALVTLCQNVDDGKSHGLSYYRPRYFAVRL